MAAQLINYRNQNCAVIALTRGSVVLGEQIAKRIHASLMILLSEKITLPGESEALAGMTAENTFTYNNMFSAGELEEFVTEYYTFIEQRRLENMHRLHSLFGGRGEINPALLQNHNIILVSDGLATGFSLDIAADFLKPIKTKKLIIAAPLASINALDRMRLMGDEVYCLSTPENLFDISHYYEDNTIPSTEEIIEIIQNMSLHWIDEELPEIN